MKIKMHQFICVPIRLTREHYAIPASKGYTPIRKYVITVRIIWRNKSLTHCLHMHQVNLHSTLLHKNCGNLGHMGIFFEVKNIALTVMVCIALFKTISELQKERLCQPCAAMFS